MILIIIFYIQVGYNAGDGVHYYSAPGARTDSMKNLTTMSNIDIPGKFIFRVDSGNGHISFIMFVTDCLWKYVWIFKSAETKKLGKPFMDLKKPDVFL